MSKANSTPLTIKRLREVLDYDPRRARIRVADPDE